MNPLYPGSLQLHQKSCPQRPLLTQLGCRSSGHSDKPCPPLVSPASSRAAPSSSPLQIYPPPSGVWVQAECSLLLFFNPYKRANTCLQDSALWKQNWHDLFNVLYFPNHFSPSTTRLHKSIVPSSCEHTSSILHLFHAPCHKYQLKILFFSTS